MTCTTNPVPAHRLAKLDLFAGIDSSDLDLVATRCEEVEVPKGRELFREGEQAREFVVVLEGFAVVTAEGRDLAYLGAGTCFGEMALIDGRRRTATVTAGSSLRALVFDADEFHFLLRELPSFAMRILSTIVGRLRLANSQLSERTGTMTRSPSLS